jgi:peroxiredoxin
MSKEKVGIRIGCLLAIFVFLVLSGYPAFGSETKEEIQALTAGMNLPQFTLDVPASEKEKQYLSLKNPKPFSLSEIPAKLMVLEIFSVYCPHCQKQAPQLNKLYSLINQDSELSCDIKMMGIAAGADQSKTDKWKATFHIPFPLFADPKTEIWEKFGKPGVPLTLVVTNSGKIESTHAGATEDIEAFFREIKKLHKQQ